MHGMHAERLEERAMHQAARGHFGRAMELERRSEIQSAEAMMGGGVRPYPMMGPCGYPGAGMRWAENAMIGGAMGGVVVAEEVAAANRLREAEMLMYGRGPRAYGGCPPIYPPAGMAMGAEIFVQPGATVYPGTNPGYPLVPPMEAGHMEPDTPQEAPTPLPVMVTPQLVTTLAIPLIEL